MACMGIRDTFTRAFTDALHGTDGHAADLDHEAADRRQRLDELKAEMSARREQRQSTRADRRATARTHTREIWDEYRADPLERHRR